MQNFIKFFIIIVVLVSLMTACSDQQNRKYQVFPNSYGKVDNIMVVADEYTWTTTIGDTLRNYFEALYPVTPQPEFIYDLQHKTPKEFNEAKILKTHRAIVIIGALDDMNDPASELIRKSIGEKNIKRAKEQSNYRIAFNANRWAQGQTVIYWFAPTRDELLKTIVKDNKMVMKALNKADTEMYIEQIYIPGQNLKAAALINNTFGINIKIPKEFVLAHNDSVAVWLRKETNKISSNIFIYSLPLSNSTKPSPEHHKYFRNKLTKSYFSKIPRISPTPSSFIKLFYNYYFNSIILFFDSFRFNISFANFSALSKLTLL